MFMKSDEVKVKISYSEIKDKSFRISWKMMTKKPVKLKKLDVIEHRKKKKKKHETREEPTEKKDDIMRTILLFELLAGVLICKVSMPQDLRKENTVEESNKPDDLFKDSLELKPGKDNSEGLDQSVREPFNRTEDLKF